ncbi:MAG: hypothetical protein HND52_10175 [Ignavibacteriae bacterium]|nr:hypothetical protein [Ignavibacteriota bacterium]NOG98315.1 hypothetical protein [Ignavibacteriota bacterium]
MNYSNTIVIFVLLTSTIICQNKNYTNEDLGLSFSYINRENSPFTLQYIDSCITRDSIIWQNFESINLRLRLKYPKTLRLKDE